MTLEKIYKLPIVGAVCYAHSVGEGYQYRGVIESFDTEGTIRIKNVEMTTNDECDFDFTNPYIISGDWQSVKSIEYASDDISIELEPKGIVLTYPYAGTVYIHIDNPIELIDGIK